ncbi:putative Cystathionine gamma-synthase 1, chloroplastic [Cocos nucifera]|uniref:Putative Cystathionine gamma-synthase 1, chloroplastic n=1 Tax=Cocos nucifera TaxID=13894 RepID=A0A8K0I9A1_COCNU|nr:putative Cystathionine gamma-synthase 1, chloroplastic [Cocos nucifera]
MDAITSLVVNTSAYWFKNSNELIDLKEGRNASFEYGHYGNPTTKALEEKMSALEKAESTLFVSSGMYASVGMLAALVPVGRHIVTITDCYRKTRIFIQNELPKMGISDSVMMLRACSFVIARMPMWRRLAQLIKLWDHVLWMIIHKNIVVRKLLYATLNEIFIFDPADMDSLKSAMDQNNLVNNLSLVFMESPTNPFLRCVDIEFISKLCHNKGALVCIDATFASPVNQKALTLGADIVLHSATKFIGGHNDVLGGYLSGSEELISKIH